MKKVTHDEIESLLENLGEIPTLPSIATTIMERTLDARVNARQIAQMVERDQALAVKVLKEIGRASCRERVSVVV